MKIGDSFEICKTVTADATAAAAGSGGLQVFGTPFLLAMMENAAFECMQRELPEGKSSVGTAAGLTQAELAERLDVSRQTVSKWELGAAQPELDKVVALSELFRVSTDWLLKKPEPREPGVSLDRLALRFLGYTKDINVISDELVGILQKLMR